MVQRTDDSQPIDRDITPDAASDEDDRLGEAIEEYLALAERDQAPDLEEFLARHDDMKEDLRAAQAKLRTKSMDHEGLREAARAIDRVAAQASLGGELEELTMRGAEEIRERVRPDDLRRVWTRKRRSKKAEPT